MEKLVNPHTANLECSNISPEGKSKNFSLFKIKDQHYYSIIISLLITPVMAISDALFITRLPPILFLPLLLCVCVCVCGITKLRSYRSWAGKRASHKQFIFSNALQWATPFYSLRYLATFSCYLSGENYFIYK